MSDTGRDIAVVGLGVMGRNLALNLSDHGISVVASDAFSDVTAGARAALEPKIAIAETPEAAADALRTPRKILMMIKAGDPVDAMIERLAPRLQPGDILIDGGNTHYRDTERRRATLAAKGIRLVGLGVSGGEEGARHGPALMAGGDPEAIAAVEPMLSAIAAKAADGEPCYGSFGPGGAGHFVKMAHNGIEYALMQTLAEAYLLMAGPGGLGAPAIAARARVWNNGSARSFLLEATIAVLDAIDRETGQPLVDVIRDAAGHKGTGRWTVEAGLELGIPLPGVAAAFLARALSSRRTPPPPAPHMATAPVDADQLAGDIGRALPAAMLAAYAQGLALVAEASRVHGWNTSVGDVARSWRAGCIIRSGLLEPIAAAYEANVVLENLTAAPFAVALLAEAEASLRRIVQTGVGAAVPIPALSAAVTYLDGFHAPRLGASLIQGQRDLFGAHTFERIDRAGAYHHDWTADR